MDWNEANHKYQAFFRQRESIHGKKPVLGQGSLTAQERVLGLLDEGTFSPIALYQEDAGVLCGFGLADGRPVYVLAQDVQSRGAAMNEQQANKMLHTLSLAQKTGAPVVLMIETEGMEVLDGMKALKAYAKVFAALARLSGICPIISVVCGKAFGVAAQFAMLSDLTIAIEKQSLMAAQSPQVLRSMMQDDPDDEALCGSGILSRQGISALTAGNEKEALRMARRLLKLLPSCNQEGAPTDEEADLNRAITAKEVGVPLVIEVADDQRPIELFADMGMGLHVFLTKVGGYPCGVIAGNGGKMDGKDMRKAATLVRLCDCFHLPVVSLVATEGVHIPMACHQGMVLRAQAQLMYAFADCASPKISVLVGDAVGAAYVAMGGESMADLCYAWPNAYVAPLSKAMFVQTFAKEALKEKSREALESVYADENDGINAAGQGLCDDVIVPQDTRKHIIAALEWMMTKREQRPEREHGNIPL